MVWRLLILLTLLAYVAASNNSRCYECSDVSLPGLCSHVTECTAGQMCAVEQYVNAGGLVKYNSGCQSKAMCSVRRSSIFGDVTMSKRSDITTCVQCCDGGYCNNQGCGSVAIQPSLRGPMCFRCDYEDAPDHCRTVTACDIGEVCMLTEIPINDEQNISYYRSSCRKAADCLMIESAIIGKKRGTLCHNCCKDDFCNDKCNHVSVSTPLMTSPVTTPIPEPTTSNMPVTTSPPMIVPTKPTTSSPTTTESTTMEASTVHVSTIPPTTPTPTKTHTPTASTKLTTAKPTTTLKPTIKTNPTATTLHFKNSCHQHHYQYDRHSHLCYNLHDERRSWYDAANICKSEGGLLAVVDTHDKWNVLKSAISLHYNGNVYIGGRDTGHPDNNFHWANGARVTFSAWAVHQPDGGNEDCIYVSHTDHWHWHDANCASQYSFVCTIQHP